MSHYDEVDLEDMVWSEELGAYTYQCPCGDLFQITLVRRAAVFLPYAVKVDPSASWWPLPINAGLSRHLFFASYHRKQLVAA